MRDTDLIQTPFGDLAHASIHWRVSLEAQPLPHSQKVLERAKAVGGTVVEALRELAPDEIELTRGIKADSEGRKLLLGRL